MGVGKSKCMLNLQILISNCKLWISLFFEKKIHDSILHDDGDDDDGDNKEDLTANVTLTPCSLALLKNAAATALGARGFSHLVPSSWDFSFSFLPLPFFVFFFSTLHQEGQPLRHLRAGISYLTKS